MSLLRLLSANLTAHGLPTNQWIAMKTRPQMISQCLYCWTSKHKFSSLTTQDIKSKVIKKLIVTKNIVNQEVLTNSHSKEILLYESSRHDYYRMLGVVGLFNYILWVFVANFGIFWYSSKLKEESKELKDSETKTGLKALISSILESNKTMLKISVVFMVFGHLILCATVIFCVRTVNFMSLLPNSSGVDKVRIYCYSVFGLPNTYHKHDIPVDQISALKHRLDSKSRFIPLKVKGETLKFRIDKRGNFIQPSIFDNTVGVKRNI